MKQHDNDNELLSFITLSAATKNVTRYLTKEDHPPQSEKRPADNGGGKKPDKNPDEERRYIEHRLREIAAFERRAGGKKN